MARQVQLRRGTTAENNVFTGAVGELTMDTDTNGLRIHDGVTVGGQDVPTAATADYVVESQLPTADNGYTWYRKYKSGWVEQGGRVAIASTPGSAVMVTFPVEMADTEYQVLYTAGTDSKQWATNYVVNPQAIYSSRTTTGVGFVDNLPKNNNACWQVSGMAATTPTTPTGPSEPSGGFEGQ